MEKKKPYTPPTLSQHGCVVEKTKGRLGICWELVGTSPEFDDDVRPELDGSDETR